MEILIFIIVIVVVLAIYLIGMYNRLVRMHENVSEAWKAISIALEERLRATGGVIDAAKRYMDHEQQTLQNVTAARAGLQSALKSGDAKATAQASAKLQSAFSGLSVQVEAYPDLKASGVIEAAQQSFEETAGKIAASEKYYNGSAREFNKQVRVFPTVLFASMLGFPPASYYEADEETQSKVNDSDKARDLAF